MKSARPAHTLRSLLIRSSLNQIQKELGQLEDWLNRLPESDTEADVSESPSPAMGSVVVQSASLPSASLPSASLSDTATRLELSALRQCMEKLSEKMESQQVALNHLLDRLEVIESVREVHISEPEMDVWRDESITPFHPQDEDVVYLVNKTDHTPPSVSPRVASPRQASVSPPLPPRVPTSRHMSEAAVKMESGLESVEPQAPSVEPQAASVEPQAPSVEPQAASVVVQPAIAIIVDPLSDEEHEIEEEEEEQPPHEDEPDIEEEEVAEAAASVEPQAASVEPQAASVEPQAASVEPQAASVEPQAASVEPQAASVEEEVVEEEEEVVEEEEEVVEEEEEVVEEEEEGEELEELVYQGVTYYKDADGFLYTMEANGELSETAIGYWKEKTQTVAFYRKK